MKVSWLRIYVQTAIIVQLWVGSWTFTKPIVVSLNPRLRCEQLNNQKLRSLISDEQETKQSSLISTTNSHITRTDHKFTTDFSNAIELDSSTYEATLLSSWETDASVQKGFDWEMEKLRRFFAGLRMREDGTWVRQPTLFDFLVSRTKASSNEISSTTNVSPPKAVTWVDVVILFTVNILASVGFGPTLGLAAVPDAIIQKYEGSFFSFIKGVLGGDLQTLAGGPLFLLLEKYYQVHGPIFNLSFGPKSFLIISDPVMARHILRSNPESYCKGVLSEILEPIMGRGLIPADPATWKVRRRAIVPGAYS